MVVALRLVLAVIFGSVIGLERELHNHPAGFRTHILVCTGSALFTLVSVNSFGNADPSRVAAQIVSGIGFLGAGTILREGATIRGLTTAASLWSVAGVGMAIGTGYYLGAILTTVLMVVVLFFFSFLEQRILQRTVKVVEMTVADIPGQLGQVASRLGELGISIKSVGISPHSSEQVNIELMLKIPASLHMHEVIDSLAQLKGVSSIKAED
ncbi:MAG: MgtC/SapB family protein [Eubacteriales bacterium]|nr:MgtC/SapB family protein [Eubacteriales bacterium]MDD3074111.1 MgtC/SapB family protein [Eubacteriales bacterium]MDD4078383.1 MgtC/SapB family protein [Eubacteriales bacterium]MDD4768626.1 MgtC/SapB family protein [Eubacteriales bacterium]